MRIRREHFYVSPQKLTFGVAGPFPRPVTPQTQHGPPTVLGVPLSVPSKTKIARLSDASSSSSSLDRLTTGQSGRAAKTRCLMLGAIRLCMEQLQIGARPRVASKKPDSSPAWWASRRLAHGKEDAAAGGAQQYIIVVAAGSGHGKLRREGEAAEVARGVL